ncbi:MAG: aldo/keto reductase [Oscillospiraceae bacterium]|jgi:aryl-alcohol dehydrogenase-like predicted oxidoreductase|nr:aldo/keto reductase [Oscillospiraceae bacterium]
MESIINVGNVPVKGIALGSGNMGEEGSDKARFEIMDKFAELGGVCFDTARLYAGGKADTSLGKWLRGFGNREAVVIVAKGCHPNRDTMHEHRLTREDVIGDLETSLKELQTDYADMYLLHRDFPKLPVCGIIDALDELVKSGKTKEVGVSNWTVGRIAEANEYAQKAGKAKLSVCQLHFSLGVTSPAQTLDVTHIPMNPYEFAWYKETGFPVMSFGTQGRGFFNRYALGLEQKPGSLQYYGHYPENFRRAERVKKLSEELGLPIAALLTAYVRDCGLNTIPLVAVSSIAQLEEVWRANDVKLSREQIGFLETGTRY